MMLPTHALAGMLLALPLALVAPEHAGVAFAGGLLGGTLPDLDMYAGHRRALHYPVYYSGAGVFALAAVAVVSSALTVAAAAVLVAAAAHSASDVLGGGLELRPWEATSERAVYDHHRGRWLEPRRWVAYDGSPGDLVLSVALAAPLLVVLDGPLRAVVLAALAVGTAYTALRRRLPAVAVLLVDAVVAQLASERVMAKVPDRYRTG